jgi:hypothetical protein
MLPGTKFVGCLSALQLLFPARVGHDRAAVHRHVAPRHQPGRGAPSDHLLEQQAVQVAVPEATVPVFGEGRVVGYPVGQIEPAEPAVSQVEVHLLAQAQF